MSEQNRIIAFDFDGVLCNSIHDSFMTAVNTYIIFSEHHHLPLSRILAADEVFRFEEAQPHFFRQFSDLMPLCNRAMDYYVLLQILEKNEAGKIKDQQAFNAVKESISDQTLESYQEQFFRHRGKMQQDPDTWSTLLPAFPGIIEAVKILSQQFALAIATSKDKNSVNILLRKYGLERLFKKEHILDKDFGRTKRDHLNHLHTLLQIDYPNIYFIDDKVSHLQIVKDLGVRACLATWGFNSDREIQIAQDEGFRLLALDDLSHL